MDNNNDMEEALHCAALLAEGKVIVYPTDTVWGIGCDATNADAVGRVFELKQRPAEKSMILLLADTAALQYYVPGIPDAVLEQVMQFTEPTTVVFDTVQHLPAAIMARDGSVAIRLTRDPFCQALIRALGKPLVSTSANLSGQPAAAVYPEIDPAILAHADYVVLHRRDDLQRVPPSRIVRFAADGTLIRLR